MCCSEVVIHTEVPALLKLLKKTNSAHLNEPDFEGCPPISIAAQAGALGTALVLLQCKADPNRLELPEGGVAKVYCRFKDHHASAVT